MYPHPPLTTPNSSYFALAAASALPYTHTQSATARKIKTMRNTSSISHDLLAHLSSGKLHRTGSARSTSSQRSSASQHSDRSSSNDLSTLGEPVAVDSDTGDDEGRASTPQGSSKSARLPPLVTSPAAASFDDAGSSSVPATSPTAAVATPASSPSHAAVSPRDQDWQQAQIWFTAGQGRAGAPAASSAARRGRRYTTTGNSMYSDIFALAAAQRGGRSVTADGPAPRRNSLSPRPSSGVHGAHARRPPTSRAGVSPRSPRGALGMPSRRQTARVRLQQLVEATASRCIASTVGPPPVRERRGGATVVEGSVPVEESRASFAAVQAHVSTTARVGPSLGQLVTLLTHHTRGLSVDDAADACESWASGFMAAQALLQV